MAVKPTLVSLAADLGVSRQTVSNVVNAPHLVKPSTRARVLAAIEESGYRPSSAARQLRTRRSMNLGMRLLPTADGINGSILDRFLHALTESAQEQGYRLTLFCADSDEGEITRYQELLQVADLDGFVLTGTHYGDSRARWLLEHGIPFAAFGRPWSTSEDPSSSAHAWVDIDGGAGTLEATRMLLEQGHTQIGFIGWPKGSGAGDDRRSGWRAAMEDAVGRPSEPALDSLAVETEDGVASGSAAAQSLIAAGATALVCASDSLALGALGTLRQLRPDSPEGAVVGFDDTPVAAAVGLSSVAQPVEEAARRIVGILTHTLSGPADGARPEQHVLLAPSLVQRKPHPLISAD